MDENAYSFNIMNSIPCEFCHTLIDIQDYEEHVNECQRQRNSFLNVFTSMPNLIDRIADNLHNTAEGDPEYIEEESEDEIEVEEVQAYDNQDTNQYEFFNTNIEATEENGTNSLFMNIPNSFSSVIPNNVQMFLSNPLPLYINNNQEENNPFMSFGDMIQSQIGDQTAETYNEYLDLAEQIGKVKIGLSDELIKEKFTVCNKTDVCCICTEEKDKFLISPCNHKLCEECTHEWYKDNKKCAHCQVEIE